MTIEQLKARAYDLLAAQEQIQKELRNINIEIQNEIKKAEEAKKDDTKK